MPTISSLWVEIKANAENFNNGLRAAQKEAKELEKTIKPTLTAAKELGTAMTAVGGAVTAAFVGMVKSSADYGEQLNKMAIQTGISTEQLSRLSFAATQNEASFESLAIGLKKMSSAANLNADAFKEIGVRVTDTNGMLRPMNDILLDISDQFHNMEDGTKKSALAVALFGRSGTELIPTLNLGSKGLADMGLQADRLGLTMGGDAARAADDFNDSIAQIKDAMLGLSNTVASALIPGLTDNSHALRDGIIAAKDFAKEHEGLTRAVALAGVALTGTGGLLLGLAGIVSIYPKVVAGLQAISVGLNAVGVSAVAATAGLAAIVYWASQVISTEVELSKTRKETAATTQLANDLIMKQWDQLVKLGIVINHGTLSWNEFGLAVGKAYKENINQILALKTTNDHLAVAATKVDKVRESFEHLQTVQKGVIVTVQEYGNTTDLKGTEIEETWMRVGKTLEFSQLDAMARISEEWDNINGKLFNDQVELFNKIEGLRETDVDENVKITTAVYNAHKKSADQTAQAWKNAIENLNTRLAESFADMIVNAKFNFESLVNIAKQTAKNMLSAFLSGLLSPLTNALANLGSQIGGMIGLGGKTGGGATGGVANEGTVGLGGMLGLSAGATFGIGAGVVAAIALAKHFIGKGRRTADEFVSEFQEPFGAQLAQVSKSGTVSDLDEIWGVFNKTASDFAGQGKTEAKVVGQAHATLDPLLAQIRQDIAAREANQTVNITVQGNAYAGIEDIIVAAVKNALRDNRGGLATAIG